MRYNYEIQEYPVRLWKEEVEALKMLHEETGHDSSTFEWSVFLGVIKQIIHGCETQEYIVKLGKEEVGTLKMLYEQTEHDDSTYEWAVVLGVIKQIIQNE